MKKLIDELLLVIEAAINAAGYDKKFAAVKNSDRPDLCEYQCNSAMRMAKELKKNPFDIACEIADKLKERKELINVTVARPGFINFDIDGEFLSGYLEKMNIDNNLAVNIENRRPTIIMDYGGPNVAKALHIGHLRSAIIGEALKRIAKFMGCRVIADVHLGDYGLQMGLIINELKNTKPYLRYFQPDFDGSRLEFSEAFEPQFTIEELGEIYPRASAMSKEDKEYYKEALETTGLLQKGDSAYAVLFNHIIKVSVSDLKKSYRRLNVSFDLWLGESDAKPYIKDMLEEMKRNGYARVDDGALVIDVAKPDDKKEIPPCIVQKSDGSSLYATTDLATIVQRKKNFNPSKIIYVVDKRQELHFTQVFRAARKCRLIEDSTDMTFIGFGTICGSDGKPLKSRDGGVMTLKALLDDTKATMLKKLENPDMSDEEKENIAEMIAMAAIKYADLSNQTSKDYIYDSNKFTSYEGNTGPYILYSLVRIRSILAKCEGMESSIFMLNKEQNPKEKKLMLSITEFANAVETAYKELSPSRLCSYLYNVANSFSGFYNDVKVISEEDTLKKQGYIDLLKLTERVLKKTLDLLAVDVPKRM